jgi:hypothetical protein
MGCCGVNIKATGQQIVSWVSNDSELRTGYITQHVYRFGEPERFHSPSPTQHLTDINSHSILLGDPLRVEKLQSLPGGGALGSSFSCAIPRADNETSD